MNFVNECELCHVEHEIKDMEYDPVLGWTCIDCEAATKPAGTLSLLRPIVEHSISTAGVKAAPSIGVRA